MSLSLFYHCFALVFVAVALSIHLFVVCRHFICLMSLFQVESYSNRASMVRKLELVQLTETNIAKKPYSN